METSRTLMYNPSSLKGIGTKCMLTMFGKYKINKIGTLCICDTIGNLWNWNSYFFQFETMPQWIDKFIIPNKCPRSHIFLSLMYEFHFITAIRYSRLWICKGLLHFLGGLSHSAFSLMPYNMTQGTA